MKLIDWEENLGIGTENNQGFSNHAGDGGMVAVFKDAADNTVATTGSEWKAQTFYTAPIKDLTCTSQEGELRLSANCNTAGSNDGSSYYGLHWAIPTDWTMASFDDSAWPSATTYTNTTIGVNNKSAYTNFTNIFDDPSDDAEFIWSTNVILDNEVIVRYTVEGDGATGSIDNDNDGIDAARDCDDNDPNKGAAQTAGTVCDDGDATTEDDVIQADGCSCAGNAINDDGSGTDNNSDFVLSSPVIGADGKLPADYTCDGAGINPPLNWEGAPEGTACFVTVMHHIDREGETKTYMILYDIPQDISSIAADESTVGTYGGNSQNQDLAYAPPCSRGPGVNEYIITVYALSECVTFETTPDSRAAVLAAIEDITLGAASLTVNYERDDAATDDPPNDDNPPVDNPPNDDNPPVDNPPNDDACVAPAGFVVSGNGNRQIIIDWADVPNASSYTIQIRFKDTENWLVTVNITTTKVRILGPLRDYEYRIKSNCGDSESAYSAVNEFSIPTDNLTEPVATSRSGEVEDIFIQQVAGLYPTLVHNTLNLLYPTTSTDTQFMIYDITGKLVYQQQLGRDTDTHTFTTDHLRAGYYMGVVQEDGKISYTDRFVKQ